MTKRTASIFPSPGEIHALPEKFRVSIHDLETPCNKSGDVHTIALPREIGMYCRGAWKSRKPAVRGEFR